jgi:peroxiredoxin
MTRIAFFLVVVLSWNQSFSQGETGFSIAGSIKGLSDKTTLYLEYTEDDKKLLDSTSLINGSFAFKGKLGANAVYGIIRTANYTNYKFLWLENTAMTFQAEKGNFRNAVITGSKNQIQQDKLNELIKKAPENKQIEIEQNFVRENPGSMISGHILNTYSSTWGKEVTSALYANFSQELKNSTYGRSIASFIALNKDIKLGDKYADFSQTDTQGKSVRLSDLEGKIILLEFWGSWCGPCRKTNPELVKVYNEFKDRGFEIMGVASETDKNNWLKAIEQDKLTWTNVSDLNGDKNEAAIIYGVSYYPTNFLIDKSGVIIARYLNIKQLRNKLAELGGK